MDKLLCALMALAMPLGALGAACEVKSGPTVTPLVELYTSEGCSSCPPADRWLSRLDGARVVPIAFHVDYWEYLGWKDPFSQNRFTIRQRHFARIAGANQVYTPQVVVDGRDYPRWYETGAFEKTVSTVNRRGARATIELAGIASAGGVQAKLRAASVAGVDTADWSLVAVLTQDGLATKVTAGENRGELLRHEHVARDLKLERFSGPRASIDTTFSLPAAPKGGPVGLVAFVQDQRTGEVLQALACTLGTVP